MPNTIVESSIDDLLKSLDDIHLYDPEFISISDDEYSKLLEMQFDAWEERFEDNYERKEDRMD